jgi:hypothetical protein
MKTKTLMYCPILLVLTIILFTANIKNLMAISPIDYSKAVNWVSLPQITQEVDVFYVYPTIYTQESPANMDITESKLRANAAGLLVAQAGVYAPYANVFAPFYRQQTAATQSMEANNGGRNAFADTTFRLGYQDVEQAFDYYMEHLNQGRPFILAGHSQGSMVMIELMRNRLADAGLQKQLIAAYVMGYSVTQHDLEKYPWMRLAQGETDTGVIITYNTQGPNAGPSPVLLTGAVAINPLNWKTDASPAGRELNQKAIIFDDASGEVIEEIPNFCGAKIDLETGALIITDMQPVSSDKIDLKHLGRWSKEVYHRYDYAFFYENLKENVKKRIDSFMAH